MEVSSLETVPEEEMPDDVEDGMISLPRPNETAGLLADDDEIRPLPMDSERGRTVHLIVSTLVFLVLMCGIPSVIIAVCMHRIAEANARHTM